MAVLAPRGSQTRIQSHHSLNLCFCRYNTVDIISDTEGASAGSKSRVPSACLRNREKVVWVLCLTALLSDHTLDPCATQAPVPVLETSIWKIPHSLHMKGEGAKCFSRVRTCDIAWKEVTGKRWAAAGSSRSRKRALALPQPWRDSISGVNTLPLWSAVCKLSLPQGPRHLHCDWPHRDITVLSVIFPVVNGNRRAALRGLHNCELPVVNAGSVFLSYFL